MRTLIAIAVALLFPIASYASCGSASCPLDLHSLNQPSAGGFTLDLSFEYIDQNHLHGHSDIPPAHLERRTINRTGSLLLRYAPNDWLQLSVSAPYVARSHQHFHDDELESWNVRGMGDVQLQARGRVTKHLWLMGGVELPTGGTSVRNQNGERAEIPLQPGSGSTDWIAGVAFEHNIKRATHIAGSMGNIALLPLFASITYRRNGVGALDHRIGNEWQMNGGTAYPLSPSLELLAQMNLRRRGRDTSPDDPQDAFFTGGTYAFTSTGIRLSRGRGAAYLLMQLPLYQHVNGIQLVAKRNWLAGLQWRF